MNPLSPLHFFSPFLLESSQTLQSGMTETLYFSEAMANAHRGFEAWVNTGWISTYSHAAARLQQTRLECSNDKMYSGFHCVGCHSPPLIQQTNLTTCHSISKHRTLELWAIQWLLAICSGLVAWRSGDSSRTCAGDPACQAVYKNPQCVCIGRRHGTLGYKTEEQSQWMIQQYF